MEPIYDLDVQNAKPAKPIVKTRYEHNPELFEYPPSPVPAHEQPTYVHNSLGYGGKNFGELATRNQNSKTIWLSLSVLFGVLTIFGIVTNSWWLVCGFPALVSLINLCIRCWDTKKITLMLKEAESVFHQAEKEKSAFEARKNEKITVGHESVCPFCMAKVTGISHGLNHCHNCGKQFHYSNERSYPIKFR
jgi:hypothetical protein